MNTCTLTPFAGRMAFVEKELATVGLEASTMTADRHGVVCVHLSDPASTVAHGEQLLFACGVAVWDVKPFLSSQPPFVLVEGKASESLTVRVFCHDFTETEPPK